MTSIAGRRNQKRKRTPSKYRVAPTLAAAPALVSPRTGAPDAAPVLEVVVQPPRDGTVPVGAPVPSGKATTRRGPVARRPVSQRAECGIGAVVEQVVSAGPAPPRVLGPSAPVSRPVPPSPRARGPVPPEARRVPRLPAPAARGPGPGGRTGAEAGPGPPGCQEVARGREGRGVGQTVPPAEEVVPPATVPRGGPVPKTPEVATEPGPKVPVPETATPRP